MDVLIGAVGVSGDGVDQDDIVGASGYEYFSAADCDSRRIISSSTIRVCLTQNFRAIPKTIRAATIR